MPKRPEEGHDPSDAVTRGQFLSKMHDPFFSVFYLRLSRVQWTDSLKCRYRLWLKVGPKRGQSRSRTKWAPVSFAFQASRLIDWDSAESQSEGLEKVTVLIAPLSFYSVTVDRPRPALRHDSRLAEGRVNATYASGKFSC
jgi:hypothetical protein